MTIKRIAVISTVLLMLGGSAAFAQTTPATSTAPGTTAALAGEAPATSVATGVQNDSREVRQQLQELLRRHPPEVGRILKLDPTLWTNDAYLVRYPALAAFVRMHPEVPNSPTFYLDSVWIPEDPTPHSAAYDAWQEMMGAAVAFLVFLVVTATLIWLVRTVIEQRRWSRLSRTQAEVHTKLLDRFSSNEELMAYIRTPAGKNFLESAPITLEAPTRAIAPPIGRLLWSLQAGVVVIAAGVGLLIVSQTIAKELADPLYAMGVLAIAVGLGFVVSAGVSYLVTRRLGLWEPPPPQTETV